jgi:hypothetical protein
MKRSTKILIGVGVVLVIAAAVLIPLWQLGYFSKKSNVGTTQQFIHGGGRRLLPGMTQKGQTGGYACSGLINPGSSTDAYGNPQITFNPVPAQCNELVVDATIYDENMTKYGSHRFGLHTGDTSFTLSGMLPNTPTGPRSAQVLLSYPELPHTQYNSQQIGVNYTAH